MRNSSAGLVTCLLAALTLCCKAGEDQVELKGIIRLADTNFALFKLKASQPWGIDQAVLLKEGERESKLEILRIDAAAGTVKARVDSTSTEFALPPKSASETLIAPASAPSKPAANQVAMVRLHGADTAASLLLYQSLVERTLLRRSNLPALDLNLRSREPMTTTELARQMQRSMAEQGVYTRTDRDKFMVVGREQDLEKVTPALWSLSGQISPEESASQIQSPATAQFPRGAPAGDEIPAGEIHFPNTDLYQVMQIFEELAKRTLITPAIVPPTTVTLLTANPITKREAIYAFLAVLALNDISISPLSEHFLVAFPTSQTNKLSAFRSRLTPKHEGTAQRTVPPPQKNVGWIGMQELLSLYESWSEEKIEAPDGLTAVHFIFKLRSPVPASEALHALDLILAWNDLELTPQPGGKGLKLSKSAVSESKP